VIRILLVDDLAHKIEHVRAIVENDKAVRLDVVGSAIAALRKLDQELYDLLIFDIVLPIREGEAPNPAGGMKLLEALADWRVHYLPEHVVGLSQFENVVSELGDRFQQRMWRLLRYDPQGADWERDLKAYVDYVVEASGGRASGAFKTDLMLVTALVAPELEAVLSLEADWEDLPEPLDSTRYYAGRLPGDGRCLDVVAATAIRPGMVATTALAMKSIEIHRPRCLAMTGIAAGFTGNFGDVVVSDLIWDYGSGKLKAASDGAIFERAPYPLSAPRELVAIAQRLASDNAVRQTIRDLWGDRGPAPPQAPRIHVGPIASGAAVVGAGEIMQRIRSSHRKAVAVEMEGYGLAEAAESCRGAKPHWIVVKGISDFGDERKGDEFQPYAAFTGAQFARVLALEAYGRS
jgi:nucleoside phosphorylase/CheY-like chemotaxis protein